MTRTAHGSLGVSTIALVALVSSIGGCDASSAPSSSIALRDPFAIIDDIIGPIRLLVFPADPYTCQPGAGLLTPDPPDSATIADAVVDVSFAVTDSARVDLPPGEYRALVRGRGNDAATMRTDVIIGSGCSDVSIRGGATQEIDIEIHPVVGMGVCGDAILSPDEQCEDANTTAGDGCSATCQTEPFLVNTTTAGGQTLPSAGWLDGQRAAVTFDSEPTQIRLMLLDETASVITSPTALSVDAEIESRPAVQTQTAVAIGGGRAATAFTDFPGRPDSDVRVRFFALADRNSPDVSVLASDDTTTSQAAPAVAAMSDGTTLVVFEDASSPTGLQGRIFAAGSTMPAGVAPFVIGEGTTAATAPAAAATDDAFFVAFTASSDVFFQRFDRDGAPIDDMARAVASDVAGVQDQPTIAAFHGACPATTMGCAIVAWREGDIASGDGDGSSIRARVLNSEGTPLEMPLVVNSTTAGDQISPVAAAAQNRFFIAWQDATGIRARVFSPDGAPALNRAKEPVPSVDDFIVAPGGAGEPAVAAGGDSRALVVWQESDADIHGRVFALP